MKVKKSKKGHVIGKDHSGNHSFIDVFCKDGKIHIYSPEDASDVIFTKKQAKELISEIENCIKENIGGNNHE